MQLFAIHLDLAGLTVRFAVNFADDGGAESAAPQRQRTSVADLPRLELSRDS
jgi:hypothetical protein